MEVDVPNVQLVGMNLGGLISIGAPRRQMSADAAIIHAAWLVAIAEPNAAVKFADALEAAKNS